MFLVRALIALVAVLIALDIAARFFEPRITGDDKFPALGIEELELIPTPSVAPASPPPPSPRSEPTPRPPVTLPPEMSDADSAASAGGEPERAALTNPEFYARYADAAMQVMCETRDEIFTASGVILNERGLVMTNAHVADIVRRVGAERCRARHGNPAQAFAGLEVVFAADTTAKIESTEVPQRDVAFLRLVKPSESFRTAPVTTELVRPETTLLTLGYPNEFLAGASASSNSNLVFSTFRVDGYADTDGNTATAEGYVTRGGIALQRGSSGTALFAPDGRVVGLIFATTKGETTAEREGIALSTPYIDRILHIEAGLGLDGFIAGN